MKPRTDWPEVSLHRFMIVRNVVVPWCKATVAEDAVTQIRVRGKIDGTFLADRRVLGERRGDTAHNAVGRLYIEQER
jgi:hypothetical protein